MKYFFGLVFLLAVAVSCKQRELSKTEVEQKLMETMKNYLEKSANNRVAFTVQDVTYYPEKNYYYCEFHVQMRSNNQDTTGTMTATITKDFKKVERKN